MRGGWFHTGDAGKVDESGNLTVGERLTDLIVTAHGTTVAPRPLEAALSANTFVDRAVVVGERRQFLAALIRPSFPALEAHARRQRWPFANRSDLLNHPRVLGIYSNLLQSATEDLDDHVRLRAFRLVDDDFGPESADSGFGCDKRRRAVEARYAALIEDIYAHGH